MPTTIDREHLLEILERDRAHLVEVLPSKEYEEEHLPGAIGLPLKMLTPVATEVLDRSRPVVVYCWDGL